MKKLENFEIYYGIPYKLTLIVANNYCTSRMAYTLMVVLNCHPCTTMTNDT